MKYLWRCGLKDSEPEIRELQKVKQYIDFEIERLQKLEHDSTVERAAQALPRQTVADFIKGIPELNERPFDLGLPLNTAGKIEALKETFGGALDKKARELRAQGFSGLDLLNKLDNVAHNLRGAIMSVFGYSTPPEQRERQLKSEQRISETREDLLKATNGGLVITEERVESVEPLPEPHLVSCRPIPNGAAVKWANDIDNYDWIVEEFFPSGMVQIIKVNGFGKPIEREQVPAWELTEVDANAA